MRIRGVEINIHAFSTSALDGGGREGERERGYFHIPAALK
jgi:hypothetical protein